MRGGCAVRFRPDTKSGGGGGGGCCPLQARYEKRGGGGGGAVHLRPDTKSGGGGGGCCPALQARYKKRGRGRGCLAEEGALPYMKGGVATPKTPPLDPPLHQAIPFLARPQLTTYTANHFTVYNELQMLKEAMGYLYKI